MPFDVLHPARPRPRAALRAGAITTAGLCLALALPTAGPASAAPDRAGTLNTRVADVHRQLDALNMKIEATVEDYNVARLRLGVAQRKAAAATVRAEQARRVYAAKRAMLAGYAASAYRTGPQGSLTAIVTSAPGDYLDRLATLDAVGHRQSEIVTATDSARRQYAGQVAGAKAAAAAALQVARDIASAKSSIEGQIVTQRSMLAGLRAQQTRLREVAAQQRAARAAAAAAAAAQQRAARVAAAASSRDNAQRPAPSVDTVQRTAPTVRLAAPRSALRPASRSASRVAIRTIKPRRSQTAPAASGRGGAAVAAAYSVLGRPYVYGAAGSSSFDCSGLTMWSWARAGVSLPHSSRAQYGSGAHVSKSALRPGDLLFFYSPISHVGMYIGGGRMVHAPHSGDVVRIATPQWGSFVGAVQPS